MIAEPPDCTVGLACSAGLVRDYFGTAQKLTTP
jgi:hypothetical protein